MIIGPPQAPKNADDFTLNIYNNPITDDCLDHVEQLQNLKKIFLWKTNVTSEGIDRINQNRSDIVINAGYP